MKSLLVSSDYLGTTASSIVDVDASALLNETTVKIIAWYDNEMGFASRSESGCRCRLNGG
jgi:glyceraldehyde 3-phosphate dehydrogenase